MTRRGSCRMAIQRLKRRAVDPRNKSGGGGRTGASAYLAPMGFRWGKRIGANEPPNALAAGYAFPIGGCSAPAWARAA